MRLLVAEDDPDLGRQLAEALRAAGYAVDLCANGEDALHLGSVEPFDAAILDLGLPVLDGLTVLDRWRRDGRDLPVLILTARDTWRDKVRGIDAGADDYLTKPFHMAELLARVRALLRRAAGHASPELTCGPLVLDTRTASVTVEGMPVALTAREYALLGYLMHHQGRVVSRAELTEHLYEQDFERDSNTIDVFVGRLRRKLGQPALIRTVRGLGFRVAPVDAD